eukprot:2812385-Rhodomonas_salina.1
MSSVTSSSVSAIYAGRSTWRGPGRAQVRRRARGSAWEIATKGARNQYNFRGTTPTTRYVDAVSKEKKRALK